MCVSADPLTQPVEVVIEFQTRSQRLRAVAQLAAELLIPGNLLV
jgi:hypothetical protein